MEGDDKPLDKLKAKVDALRREVQEVQQALMAIREMLEDRDQH